MSRTGGLVNNAGVTSPVGPFAEARTEDLRRVLDVNVLGVMKCCVMKCCRRAARDTTRAGGGAIVNVSFGAATLGSPGQYVPHAASKAAMEVQSECLTSQSRVGGADWQRAGRVGTRVLSRAYAASGRSARSRSSEPTTSTAQCAL